MNSIKTIINEHFVYRKQIIKLAKSDLIKTYRGSALGGRGPLSNLWLRFSSFGLLSALDLGQVEIKMDIHSFYG